jgi:hypothetical protein
MALLSTGVWAVEKVTTIAAGTPLQLRAHSSTHVTVGARKMQMLYVAGLENGCTSVYMFADTDPVLYKTMAAGVLAKMSMTLIYDIDLDKRGPWGDPLSCPLTSVTVMP